MRTRNHSIQVYLDDKEKALLDKDTARLECDASKYLRWLIVNSKPIPFPDGDYKAAVQALRELGYKINSLAATANSGGVIDDDFFDKAMSELLTVYTTLGEQIPFVDNKPSMKIIEKYIPAITSGRR